MRRSIGPVLVVDDDPDVLLLAARAIRHAGCDPVVAPGGDEALHLMIRGGLRPSMVILDHSMPGRDGLSVLRELRTLPQGASLPIVMFTTRIGAGFREAAAAAGANGCVAKPADVGGFQAAVLSMLQRWIFAPSPA